MNMSDGRVWGAVALAPWDAGGVLNEGMSNIQSAVLTLTGTEDETTPLDMVDGLVESMGEHPNEYGKMLRTGHYSYSPIACQLMGGDGCGPDYLDLETVKSLTNQSTVAFLAAQLGWGGAAEQFPVVSEHIDWD